jgi:metal-responsive CopG/Arc/MetJ family transcriptional regulator
MTKVLISFHETLLRRIDRLARSQGLTRSAYLRQLAERDIARAQGPGRNPAARRALARLDQLFATNPSDDSTAAIRAERDAR